jgi:1-acyl-sn-glycerol-3-phosphate acyltransferase
MLSFLRGPVLGAIMLLLLCVNTMLWAVPVYAAILLKVIAPTHRLRERLGVLASNLAQAWAQTNVRLGDCTLGVRWDVRLPAGLKRDGQYLIFANHQTWNDIYVLLKAFGWRAPFFKFFLKKELMWVPVLGPVWWGLDYPFMRRHSREAIAKNPALRKQDMETTRKACAKYANIPVAILNFLEGTRFTTDKHDRQKSPYRHLLKPKSGGLAFALEAMGDKLGALLDVTIVYPEGATSFWSFLAGRVHRVIVEVRSLRIPREFLNGDYDADPEFRRRINAWVAELWAQKDKRIDELLAEAKAA